MMPGEHERERKPSTMVSDEKKLWALSEIENGRTVRDVSDELGVTTATVYNWKRYFQQYGRFTATASDLKARRVERRKKLEAVVEAKTVAGYTYADRVRIVTAYEDGDMTAREIREKYGVPHADLLAWREQVGDEPDPDEDDAPEAPTPIAAKPIAAKTIWEPTSTTSTGWPSDAKPIAVDNHPSFEVHEATKVIVAEKAELQRQLTVTTASHAKLTAETLRLESELRHAKGLNAELQKEARTLRTSLAETEQTMRKSLTESEHKRAVAREEVAALRAEVDTLRSRPPSDGDAALRADNAKLRERVRMLAQMLGEG